jgi:hypothetical protein
MRIPAITCVCLLGAVAAAACGKNPSADRPAAADTVTTEAADWTTYEVPDVGLTISFPSSWKRATGQLMPMLGDPRELVALGTSELRPGGENCAHMPENAVEEMGPTDAFVVVEERLGELGEGSGSAGYPQRPQHFGPDDGYASEAVDCLDRPKEFFDRFIPFRDEGRRFYAYVAFGNEASLRIREAAWAILDGLDIEPQGSA